MPIGFLLASSLTTHPHHLVVAVHMLYLVLLHTSFVPTALSTAKTDLQALDGDLELTPEIKKNLAVCREEQRRGVTTVQVRTATTGFDPIYRAWECKDVSSCPQNYSGGVFCMRSHADMMGLTVPSHTRTHQCCYFVCIWN